MGLTVRKNGRITIPANLRKKYRIEGQTRLKVAETKEGILFKVEKS
jgi:AbrB family looped-hinge helix DNA binding protein